MAETEEQLKIGIEDSDFPFPERVFLKSGKISRGEQYLGLPYWVLDFPRKFEKESTFAFRTIVWWGNEISCFLHLAGEDLAIFQELISSGHPRDNNQYVAVGSSPWAYHFEESNYKLGTSVSNEAILRHIEEYDFHKIIYRLSLNEIGELPRFAKETFTKILAGLL